MAICKCCGILAQEQRDMSFTKESYMEMLESIRGATKDNKTIYLMRDNASIHSGIDDVNIKMQELNIIAIKNVAYRFEF